MSLAAFAAGRAWAGSGWAGGLVVDRRVVGRARPSYLRLRA
jgi:hypothetical protein